MTEPMTAEQIRKVCDKHGKWLRDEPGGGRAYLDGAYLTGANLAGNVTFDAWLREIVPALVAAGGVPVEEVLTPEHWSCHNWNNCPMAAAFRVKGMSGVPALHRLEAERFVQFFDAGLVPLNAVRTAAGLPPVATPTEEKDDGVQRTD